MKPAQHLRQGLTHLSEEGATQLFMPVASNDLILGAVGVLQFDVVVYRLLDEYKVDCAYEPVSVATARWVECDDAKMLADFKKKADANLALDGGGSTAAIIADANGFFAPDQSRWSSRRGLALKTRPSNSALAATYQVVIRWSSVGHRVWS